MNHTTPSPNESKTIGHVGLRAAFNHPSLAKAKQRVRKELKRLGVSRWGFLKLETRYLPRLIHHDEHFGGVVYGHNDTGSVLLAATNKRVIYLDRKPFMVKSQDINYNVVAGVTLEWVGYRGTLILNTRFGDYKIHTLNRKAAETFRNYIERRWLEFQNGTSQSGQSLSGEFKRRMT